MTVSHDLVERLESGMYCGTSSRLTQVSRPYEEMLGDPKQRMQEKMKGDPYLTRLIYGFLAWTSGVPVQKGYSHSDWLRQLKNGCQPGGIDPPRSSISMDEVRKHSSKHDAWTVLNGKVYDVTEYMKYHPGGSLLILNVAGKDATSPFMKHHPWVAGDALLQRCLVGCLEEGEKKL